MTEPDRSLTYGFTPLSMTATVTPAPRVTDQAASALSMLSTHCCLAWMLSAGAAAASRAGAAGSAASETRPAAASRAVPGRHPRVSIRASRGSGAGPGRRRACARRSARHPAAMLVISASEYGSSWVTGTRGRLSAYPAAYMMRYGPAVKLLEICLW